MVKRFLSTGEGEIKSRCDIQICAIYMSMYYESVKKDRDQQKKCAKKKGWVNKIRINSMET